MDSHIVSYFGSVISKQKEADLPIESILNDIKRGKWAKQIIDVRNAADKETRDKLKKRLPVSTISCTTNGSHKATDFLQHSGLLQIDIDVISKEDSYKLKEQLKSDPIIHSCFLSPSEKLKGTIKIIPDLKLHAIQAECAARYFKENYSVAIDKSCKDITRLMYMSYDPDLYYNPTSQVFNYQLYSPHLKMRTQQQLDAIKIIEEIERQKIDITGDYANWIKVIYSLIKIFENDAREYVHRVSCYHPDYTYLRTENQYEACLKSNNGIINGNTLFYFAKEHGINFKGVKSTEDSHVLQITRVKNYISSRYFIRLNSVNFELEYRPKGHDNTYTILNENSLFIELLEKGFKLSINTLCALLKSDFVATYDPFEDYFTSLKPWDGVDYIQKLAQHISAKDQISFNSHFKKWLVRVVACALRKDYYNKQALILVGERQDTGKSTWCRFLCPPSLNNYIAENISTDKDSRILLAKNLLINLDELALMGKSDLNSLKSYFSKTQINERLPWGKSATIIKRRCSFMGSTNENEFLSDETGSVRWLCFEIDSIDWAYTKSIDIDKVYAQAYYLYQSGTFQYDLTRDEVKDNEKRNKEFQILTIERELLQKYIESGELDNGFYTPTEIVLKLNKLTGNALKINHVQVGKALKMMGFFRTKHRGIYGYIIE